MRVAYSVYFWAMGTVAMLLAIPLVILIVLVLPRAEAWPLMQRIFRGVFALLGVRVRAEGLELLDRSQTYVLMGNHVNMLDHFALCQILPVPIIGLEKEENFAIPLYGSLISLWGNVPVSRSKDIQQARQSVAVAKDKLQGGENWLLVFPEGTRTQTGAIAPFKKGGFHLALDAGIQIAPFTINGAWEILATGRFWAQPGTITITFAPPIGPTASGQTRPALEVLVEAVREAIEANYRGPRGTDLIHVETAG